MRRLALGAALAAVVALAAPRPAVAGEEGAPPRPASPSRYATVPPGIAALVGTPAQESLAERAVVAIVDPDPGAAARAARDLLLAGDAGLRRAAERLAAGPVTDRVLLLLLDVVAASPRPEVDALLAAAAGEARSEARAVAARALGAGRTAGAVETLARLAADPVRVVRGSALRSLFALETPAALVARTSMPPDRDPDLASLRLRLHRLRGDRGDAVVGLASLAYATGDTPALRLEGARLLTAQGAGAPLEALSTIVREFAGDEATDAAEIRLALGAPPRGYDAAASRLAAAEAVAALLRRTDAPAPLRAVLLDLAVEWIAHPVRARGRQVDEEARSLLFAALPDAGADLAGPVVASLSARAFEDPALGARLLLSLDEEVALAALRRVATARPSVDRPVLAAVSGGFRDLRRIGDPAIARALLAPAQPGDIRVDAVAALAGEPAAVALPLLVSALADDDDAVASRAAEVLVERREPEARAALERGLLDARWRGFEQILLRQVTAPADDDVYAFLARALREGPRPLRLAVLTAISEPGSPLRGPRAAALVRIAIDEPALGLDVGQVATPLASVDGPAAVRWVREHLATWRSPGVLLRNLQVVAERDALDLALEVAASLRDDQDAMLQEVATVLSGACAHDPSRTDPFWRRLLTRGSPSLRRIAISRLLRVDHGPMAALLVSTVADRDQPPEVRREAMLVCAAEKEQPPTALLWAVASDRTEQDDLREAAAGLLVSRTSPALRAKALAWLSEKVEEPTEAVTRIAEIAGHGAGEAEAADLLQLLRDDLAQRYRERPYFRPRAGEEDQALGNRAVALIRAIAASGNDASLDALAAHLFDARFSTYSAEARLQEAFVHGRGGGPLSPLVDPPELEILLNQAEEDPNATPAPPIPPEASEIVDALARQGPQDVTRRLERALHDAADSGRLAPFSDLYLLWLANRLRLGGASPGDNAEPSAETEATASVLEDALRWTAPAGSPEELVAAGRRSDRLEKQGKFALAAQAAAEATHLAARLGVCDLPPSLWVDRGQMPPPSWLDLRARQDLLEGAAAAGAGKTDEARDAFRRGVARAPLEPRVLRAAARLRAASGLDLATAEDDALRACALERRQGENPSFASRAALAFVRARRAATGSSR